VKTLPADFLKIRQLLWDDDEGILIAPNVKTTGPICSASEIREQPAAQFCCPNGFRLGSSRKKQNVERRHTWVIEHDDMPLSEQRAMWKGSDLPHTLRVFSGNKSIHTVIRCAEDVAPSEWDPATLFRTPNGKRSNGCVQAVEFSGERVALSDIHDWLKGQLLECYIEGIEDTEVIEVISNAPDPNRRLTVEEAIEATLPNGPKQRHRRIFDFARALRYDCGLGDASTEQLRAHVAEWFNQAKPFIETQSFIETWVDFQNAFPRTKKGIASSPLVIALADAKEDSSAAPEWYDNPLHQVVFCTCRNLAKESGGEFFASTHDLGRRLGQKPMTIYRILQAMMADGFCTEIKKGRPPIKATIYQWQAT
jgi:hypothetical protein